MFLITREKQRIKMSFVWLFLPEPLYIRLMLCILINSGYSIPASDLATVTNWDWRYNTTIYAVNGATIEYSIVRYSETVNEGTFTIDSATGIITCNNVNIASNLVITVKATVKYNWGTVEKTIDVNAGLNQ